MKVSFFETCHDLFLNFNQPTNHDQLPPPYSRPETLQLNLGEINAYSILVGRPEGKGPGVISKLRWDDNIKMDLMKIVDGKCYLLGIILASQVGHCSM